jgi:hypothetical protein
VAVGGSTLHYFGYDVPVSGVATEICELAKLNRANRVEQVSRRIRGTAFAVLAAAGIAAITLAGPDANAQPTRGRQIEYCSDVAIDGQTLVPVGLERAEQLQKTGELVCTAYDSYYLAVGSH